MRIFCCLNRDLASSAALNHVLPVLSGHTVRVGLTEQVGRPPSSTEHPARRVLRFAEQTFPNEVLFPLVERCEFPDAGNRYLTFAEVERHRKIPVAPLPDPNSPQGCGSIREFAPDVILSIRYGAIFRAEAIAIPRFGVLNLHSGLLPSYRGVLATFRALMNGDAQIGCTLHVINDATIDTGPVISTALAPVTQNRSLLWHVLSLYPRGAKLIADALSSLSSGTVPRAIPPASADSAYYSHPRSEDWEEFYRRGGVAANARDLAGALALYFCNQEMPASARRLLEDGLASIH